MTSNETEILCRIFDLGRAINSNQLDYDLTVIQLRTLSYIYNNGNVKPTDIAKKFDITPASVTSQIDTLVEYGWLERIYNKNDKRVIEVALTTEGKNKFPKAIQDLKSRCSWILDSLNEDEKQEFLKLIQKMGEFSKK